jgi:hypothetical protein
MPRPTDTKKRPKQLKKEDKGRLPRNHPAILFLADLCHHVVQTFGKALWALLKGGKKTSEINVVDWLCLIEEKLCLEAFLWAKTYLRQIQKNG